ncbi:hypothetical protein M0R04_09840 [Candidatus Dojkabacteria bacterium]|jgi:hypothetical protein|nr:hypothetical protein [Candidatus Dojkabacteria bacterium]
MAEAYVRNEIKEIIFYLFLGLTTAIIIPLFIGFSLLAFEESFVRGASLSFGSLLVTFLIYIVFTVVTMGLIIFPIAALVSIKRGEHPATQSNSTWFRIFTVSYIFSPENGLLYRTFDGLGLKKEKNPFRGGFNFIRIIALSIIVFWLLGILQILAPSLQFSGVPSLQAQQVTVATDVAFVSLIPAWSETMTILFLLFTFLGITAYFTAKIKQKTTALLVFFTIAILVCASLTALAWAGLHRIVYGNSDVALFATLLFGFIGSVLTILTGTFIPFWIWHIFNNVYARLGQLVPQNEDIIFISLLLWGLFVAVYIAFEIFAFKHRKKNTIENSF